MRKCSSWQFCHGTVSAAAPKDEKFCEACRQRLDIIRGTFPKSFNKSIRQTPRPAPVVVKREKPQLLHDQYRKAILKKLEAGPFSSRAPADAVGADVADRTYGRTRAELVKEGLVTATRGGGPGSRTYALSGSESPVTADSATQAPSPVPQA